MKPVAEPVRRIPCGLRKKVDEKLEELLQADIIEEVLEGPSGWISPLVVVPKSDGYVRICVDMRHYKRETSDSYGRRTFPRVQQS